MSNFRIAITTAVIFSALIFPAAGAASAGVEAIEREIAASDAALAAAQARLKDRVRLDEYRPLVTVSDGEELWSAALQRALDEHEIVEIPARSEPYFLSAPVCVPSDRRIEACGAEIRLAKGVTNLMLRSAAAVDGTARPVPPGGRTRNIAVIGGRWADNSLRRRGYGKSGCYYPDGRREGDFYGVSTLFYFGNADAVTIRDATFVRCGAFAVQCGDGDGFLFERLRFEDCFADGLHLNGNLSRVHARDIRGKVGDDLVALNAYDWLNSSVNFGPQRCLLCEDLELVLKDGKGYPAIRLQPAKYRYADGSVTDCSMRDIIFRRVKGIVTYKLYFQTPGYFLGDSPEWGEAGSGGNIHFEDIEIDLDRPIDRFEAYEKGDTTRGHFGAFELGADLDDVTFRNIDIVFHADRYPLSHLVTVGPKSICHPPAEGRRAWEVFDPYISSTVGRITLENIRIRGVAPRELVHETVFEDVDGDGRSTGRGRVLQIERK